MEGVLLPSRGEVIRDSPVPFYFQLKRLFEREIVSGRWKPGDRIPSETETCARFGLSRATVRQAFGVLENEGFVRRARGQGTFVEDGRTRSWLLQSSEGFFHDEVDRMGRDVTSRIVRADVEPLPLWASEALGMPKRSEGVTVERLRFVDGELALYVINHLPEHLAGTVFGSDIERGSLYECLAEKEGITVHGGLRTVEAVVAEGKLAELLEVTFGAPLVFIESVSWDWDLKPFDCYHAWLRTDRMKIEVEVSSMIARRER
jgi:GntR family transcriptional regulator